jgi:hypothetical protein
MDANASREAIDAAEEGHRSSSRHWSPSGSLSTAFLSGWRQGQAPVANMLFRWMHTRTMPPVEQDRVGTGPVHDLSSLATPANNGTANGDVAIEIQDREVDARAAMFSSPTAVRQSETPTHSSPHAASSPLLTPHQLGRPGSASEQAQPRSARTSLVDDRDGGENAGAGAGRDAGPARYDLQQAARWLEQALPFVLLLIMVFIREHMQGRGT